MSVPVPYILWPHLPWRVDVNEMGYTRWDPKARAGAVAVREAGMKGVEALSGHVSSWARYQNLTGEKDSVDVSPITGVYDWRSYIQEEAQFAMRREEKDKPRDKKAERAPAPPAPSGYYA